MSELISGVFRMTRKVGTGGPQGHIKWRASCKRTCAQYDCRDLPKTPNCTSAFQYLNPLNGKQTTFVQCNHIPDDPKTEY